MLNKKIMINSIIGTMLLSTTILQSNTLNDDITDVLNTNPVIQEKLRNFRITQQDLNIAISEYYPTVDFKATTGRYKAGKIKDEVKDVGYNSYQTSLTLTQNLFDGFGTTHKENYEKARIIAAGYKYIEVSNDIVFKMTSAYLEVLRAQDLLKISRSNVVIYENMYKKVQDLFEGGLTTDSEVKKIASSLSLARSNFTVKMNTAIDREYAYKRILGRMPQIQSMKKPTLEIKMPSTIQRATLYAIEHNPSILVSNYNIKGSQALWKQKKKDYYPKLDFVLEQKYNDADPKDNGYDGPDDRFSAKLVLSYNLFRGGADKANVQKHVSKINQEIDIKRDLQRKIVEDLELSWNSYTMVDAQLIDLKEYSKYSENTLSLYNEEFSLGRRTLLELLTAQNDAIGSKSQVIDAQYDALFARYRILDAMGLLVLSIQSSDSIGDIVNIGNDELEIKEILDTVPIRLDIDNDNIVDNIDICDNSIKSNSIMPEGCVRIKRDNDNDGILDLYDRCPATPNGIKVNKDGCQIIVVAENTNSNDELFSVDGLGEDDLSIDEVTLDETIEPEVENELAIVEEVAIVEDTVELPPELILYFKNDSDQIDSASELELQTIFTFLNKHENYKAQIVGHTSKTKVSNRQYNIVLSQKRAKMIKDQLVLLGISQNRLTSQGKGFSEPIASNDTQEGASKNRRIMIKLIKEEI